MWRCICGIEESLASSEALSCRSTTGNYLVAGLSEQLAQYEQLVVQLIDQYPDKETQLQVRDEHLKLLEDLKVKLRENEEALLEKTQLVDVLQKKLNRNNRDLALLEDFNEKLWEREEELRETTEHVKVLQKKLERMNCVIMELVEDVRKLEDENEDLDNKYYAEDYASYIKICGLRATHKAELTNLKGKHSTRLCKIREKHAQETSQKDQCCLQLHKDLQLLRPHARFCAPLAEQATGSLNYFSEWKINELEGNYSKLTC
ncbi:myosin heavy chain, non-muscle-like isoform X1 [Amblyraja radiata]|uniref:myosin heavy chain, non-muscle-like isoform X1 n=1 Tax=Amblyraja radiata TaxID=386614 RepID=UPI001403149B|nr:myosin heavy chain, non-muscle-like isoform X1 [Amblyraja radiata]